MSGTGVHLIEVSWKVSYTPVGQVNGIVRSFRKNQPDNSHNHEGGPVYPKRVINIVSARNATPKKKKDL